MKHRTPLRDSPPRTPSAAPRTIHLPQRNPTSLHQGLARGGFLGSILVDQRRPGKIEDGGSTPREALLFGINASTVNHTTNFRAEWRCCGQSSNVQRRSSVRGVDYPYQYCAREINILLGAMCNSYHFLRFPRS